MKNLFKKILVGILGLASIGSALVAYASTVPQTPAVFETYLANQQQTTDTTATLANGMIPNTAGQTLTGYVCLTIDSNSSSLEYECGTAAGTSITNITRGIDGLSGTTSDATNIYPHRRGADVKVSDYPTLGILARILDGIDTIPQPIQYASTISTTTIAANRNSVASVGLLQDTSFSGAGAIAASTNAKGYVQIATNQQQASSTATGSTGAVLVISALNATSTYNPSSSLESVITQNNNKIDPNFIATSSLFATNIVNVQGTQISTRYGGTGILGATSTSAGTTTINMGGVSYFEQDYSSISITGTGAWQFTNPNTNGTIIVIKDQGNFTDISTAVPSISVMADGGAASTNGVTTFVTETSHGSAGSNSSAGPSPGNGGAGGNLLGVSLYPNRNFNIYTGGGGGLGGTDSNGNGGGGGGGGASADNSGGGGHIGGTTSLGTDSCSVPTPGAGGGGLYVEVGGTFTNSGTWSAAGSSTPAQSVSNGYCGGSGGGGGGSIIALYNALGSNTGTYTVSGGLGTALSNNYGGSGGNGGNGFAYEGLNEYY